VQFEHKTKLIHQISQIKVIPSEILLKMEQEISLLNLPWTEVYKDYQSSGWKTVSLLSRSGEATDLIIDDGTPIETDILQSLPTLKKFLDDLNLKYMWARLARLEPNSFLWEHRDYTELNSQKRLRLHLPILTNKDAQIILSNHQFNLGLGFLWKLDPQVAHGACNTGPTARIHLIIDCYFDDKLESLINKEWLDLDFVAPLPSIQFQHEEERMAMNLAKLDFYQTAERILLKTYHSQVQSEGACYDKIIKMYEELGQSEKSHIWIARKNKFLSHGISA
jgi:hypothetical protein